MNKRSIVSIILIVVSVGLAVFAYIILPDVVVIQFSIGSSGNSTAPKLIAILIPMTLGIGGAVSSLFSKNYEKSSAKSLFVSGVGIALSIFMIAVNFFMK